MAYQADAIQSGPTLGVILGDLVHDLQSLFRSEARLAKAELTGQVVQAKTAAGMYGAAAVAGLFAGFCLVTTCIAAISTALPVWAASLIMAGVLGCIGGFLYLRAKRRMGQVHVRPEQTIETLREDVQWLKQQTR